MRSIDRVRLKKKYAGRITFFVILLLALALCPGLTVKADKDPVRVGVLPLQNFCEFDANGEPWGYCIDYLNKISGITGWEYEYVQAEDLTEGIELLKSRRIDLLAPGQITEERVRELDYSAYPFGTEYVVLVTAKDNDKYEYEDYNSFQGMKVAAAESYLMTEQFLEYQEENGFHTDVELYPDSLAAIAALDKGETDAALISLMMAGDRYKVIDKFAPDAFYFMTWKGNSPLLEELDAAMAQIKTDNPSYEQDLTGKYFPNYKWQYFTREEQEYIASRDETVIWYIPNRNPVSCTDEKTGELRGIFREIFDRIQQVSGLKFVYRELPEGEIDIGEIQERGFCILAGVENNEINKKSPVLYVSDCYLSSKKVLVTGPDRVFDKQKHYKLGVYSGSETLERVIREAYPNFEIQKYRTNEECFAAAQKGRVDLLLMNQYVADYWLSMPKYEKYQVIPLESLKDEMCFGIYVPWGEKGEESSREQQMMISILNKAISYLSKEEVDSIVIRETMIGKYHYDFADFVYKYKEILFPLLFVVTITIFILIYAFVQKKKSEERLAQQLETQEKLALEQKRYSLLIEKSEAPVFELSLQPSPSLAEGKMMEKLGWSLLEKKVTADPKEIPAHWKIHPEDVSLMEYAVYKSYEQKQSSECTVRLVTPGGDYRWFLVSRYPILDKEGKLISVIGQVMDVDEKVREREYFQQQSQLDDLTGLLNKRAFLKKAGELLAQKEGSVSFVFLDLDYFKQVNDTLGHIVGDRAIREMAWELNAIFEGEALICRFGGDEFCIFARDLSKEALREKLACLVKEMRREYRQGDKWVSLTVSAGAYWREDGQTNLEHLLEEADKVLYDVKRNGRNGMKVKTP